MRLIVSLREWILRRPAPLRRTRSRRGGVDGKALARAFARSVERHTWVPEVRLDPEASWILNQSGLPYLKLDLRVPASAIAAEINNIRDLFVPHRDDANSRGWYSFCVHGKAFDATREDEYYNDSRPHIWTAEALARMPETVRFFRDVWPHTRYQRLRIMRLSAGGFIGLHRDTHDSGLGPINMAITQPRQCRFFMERAGIVPFRPGDAFLLDVSNRHAVINDSREDRYHIIVNQTPNQDFENLVIRSYRARTSQSLARRPSVAADAHRRFVIVGHGRSGTTLLQTTIGNHPDVRMLGEILSRDMEVYVDGRRCREDEDGASFLKEVAFRRQDSKLATGFKILLYQARKGSNETAWQYLIAEKDIYVIHVVRDNLLAMLTSYEVALRTGEWVRDIGGESVTPTVEPFRIEPAECARQFDYAEARTDWARKEFAHHPSLTLEYESNLCADLPAALDAVWRLLQLPACPPKPLLLRQATRAPRQQISNFDELKRFFARTPYSRFFE